ncbi:MAK10-like protein [Tanacetum coccineum]
MGDGNPIRTLGDYSKSSHEGYKNTIELSIGNNVVSTRQITEIPVKEAEKENNKAKVDFVILDIKEDEKRPFILGTPFLTTAKAVIKFDKGTITLRSGKSKVNFHRIPESLCKGDKGIKNDIEPKTPTMIVNRLVLKWEEKIKLHQEREMEFDR